MMLRRSAINKFYPRVNKPVRWFKGKPKREGTEEEDLKANQELNQLFDVAVIFNDKAGKWKICGRSGK